MAKSIQYGRIECKVCRQKRKHRIEDKRDYWLLICCECKTYFTMPKEGI